MLELIQTLRLIANKLYKKTNKIKLFIFPCSYFRISRATAKQFDKNIPCLLVDCRILPACVALKKYDRLFNIIYRFQFAIFNFLLFHFTETEGRFLLFFPNYDVTPKIQFFVIVNFFLGNAEIRDQQK